MDIFSFKFGIAVVVITHKSENAAQGGNYSAMSLRGR